MSVDKTGLVMASVCLHTVVVACGRPMPPYNAMVKRGDSIECRLCYAALASTDPTTNYSSTGQNSTACQ